MTQIANGVSAYLFDIDDNLLFLPTSIYLWNAEKQEEKPVSSGAFAAIQNALGKPGQWQSWAVGPRTFRDFRDDDSKPHEQQQFIVDLVAAIEGPGRWQGPSWSLLVHAATNQRPTAMVTARGHAPETIRAGLQVLIDRGLLPAMPPILGIYTVTNPKVQANLGVVDPAMTVPSIKKLAIKTAVAECLQRYGVDPPHRFGMSDDDPNNVVLAISAMRDCKMNHPTKRFFVINSNHEEFVKLEIFPISHPATVVGEPRILSDVGHTPAAGPAPISGGNVSVYVSNMDRAVEFYTKSLGLPLKVRIANEWAEVDAGKGLTIGLHPASPTTVTPGTAGAINIELGAQVPIEQVMELLMSRGVTFVGAIENYPNVRLARLKDPDGNVLLLAQVIHHG